MKLFSTKQIREWDKFTIDHEPISSLDLMERASTKFTDHLLKLHSKANHFIVVCGPGNNGGDGLAIARLLGERGKQVQTFLFDNGKALSEDNQSMLSRCTNVKRNDFEALTGACQINEAIVIDALLGSGLDRPLTGIFAEIVVALNQYPNRKISVDIPSGLPSDILLTDASVALQANEVYTFQQAKRSFLFPEHELYVPSFTILDIGLHQSYSSPCNWHYISWDENLRMPERGKYSHKGSYGKLAIVGGSKGMGGAMVLASTAALRSGVGLCTAVVPNRFEKIMQTSIPDATLVLDQNSDHISEMPPLTGFKALAIGPGLGEHADTKTVVQELLQTAQVPMVIDADALNIIANHNLITTVPKGAILTPHLKEFERLFGTTNNSLEALELQIKSSVAHELIIVRKGAHTCISDPAGNVYFNSTGNSGMAKGGSGDVLTGVIGSLLAQGFDLVDAAIKGVYYHGKAGDKLAANKGKRTMLASELSTLLFMD
jgi:ADP-dependent NAD(P)H-hydrate dehydratase / NAD(P)H-hydrate epimerase